MAEVSRERGGRALPGVSNFAANEITSVAPALAGGSFSQTLSRGVQVLEVIAGNDRPMSAAELSEVLDMHRSVIYRLVRTLEKHRLLTTEPGGRYTLGLGLLTLARSVQHNLRAAAASILADLSAEVGATAILGLVERDDIVCIASVEPSAGLLRVRYREGTRHTIGLGAGGLAVLSGMPAQPNERAEVGKARELGYAATAEELEEGAAAVSAPVLIPRQQTQMSVTVLMPASLLGDPEPIGRSVIAAAARVAALF